MEKFILRNKAGRPVFIQQDGNLTKPVVRLTPGNYMKVNICLLYTSDAADERSSVDLGGRHIIKKKKTIHMEEMRSRSNKLREKHCS